MDHFVLYLFPFSVGAFFVPILCRQLHIPNLVGEMLYGVLLYFLFYQPGLDLKFIDHLAEMGFIFLMFLAGLELNFDKLSWSKIKLPLIILGVCYLSGFLCWKYYFSNQDIFFILLITATSVGVLFLGLKLHGVEQTEYGQSLIWLGSLGELLSIFLLIFYGIAHKYENFRMELIWDITSLFILLGIVFLIIRLIMLFLWYFPNTVNTLKNTDKIDSSELSVRLALLAMLTMVTLTVFFNLEIILGAFLGGMMFAFIFRKKDFFEHKLNSIGHGFFIPFFFMKLGWDFMIDAHDIPKVFEAGLQFYLLIFFIHLSGSSLLLYYYKKKDFITSLRNTLAAVFLLSAPLTLLVATAKLGYGLHIISKSGYQSAILAAMLGGLVGPIGFSLLYSNKGLDVQENAT